MSRSYLRVLSRYSPSLQQRVAAFAAAAVAMVVVLAALSVYLVISRYLSHDLDDQLRTRVHTIADSGAVEALNPTDLYALSSLGRDDLRVALVLPDRRQFSYGPAIPVGEPERAVADGEQIDSIRTTDGYRVAAARSQSGVAVVLAQPLTREQHILRRLGAVLLVVGSILICFAAAAGFAVARTGLRPVTRLRNATEEVARTGALRPIEVVGDDELADLSRSFNTMLFAVRESRGRQRQLIAAAGAELSTPLTSLRTNLELLISSAEPGAAQLDRDEREEIFADVLARMGELSTMVNNLVELARDDDPQRVTDDVELTELVRRAAATDTGRFEVQAPPALTVRADETALNRALGYLLETAATRAATDDPITVRVVQAPDRADVVVADHGAAAASTGLGMAIVRKVARTHGGVLHADSEATVFTLPLGTGN
ncbi:sensor histidine kinase [Skermania piniformis]|uniref:histidine kinase n=1 Tax=Skermania pinensis TaxID=39122 RepID=A0ABX8S9W9_9ACTN|nr:HAMP domain-containing sensor histidine kinase [Skermania piniformis]QXQ14617.1 HAMP domain-containing histidine kinase [Skermania piniformis]